MNERVTIVHIIQTLTNYPIYTIQISSLIKHLFYQNKIKVLEK